MWGKPHTLQSQVDFFPLKMCSKLKTRYFCQNCYVSMQIQHVKKKNDYAELHGLLHSFFLS